jgi:arylsulfatase A-like enzyme
MAMRTGACGRAPLLALALLAAACASPAPPPEPSAPASAEAAPPAPAASGMRPRLEVGPPREVTWARGPDAAPAGPRPPNIVLILVDDLGYNDISLHGGVAGGRVRTPHIDSLAADGVRFAQGYTGHSNCAPSRAALMTGRYPTRFGFAFTPVPLAFARNLASFDSQDRKRVYRAELEPLVPPVEEMGLPTSEVTLAELLEGRGYHSVLLGKWHLGEAPRFQPDKQGFDEYLGFFPGASLFLPEDSPDVVNAKLPLDPIDSYLWRSLQFYVRKDGVAQPFAPDAHMTDYLSDAAVEVIEANRNRPFFLYLAYNAPHTPLQALKSDHDALADIADPTLRVYGAMIAQLDRGIGRVLAALEANGLAENTLVIFTSDNGGADYVGLDELNAPFRGWKSTFFEGGVRTPFLMRWPAGLPAGAVVEAPVSHFDIFATAAAAAGAQPAADRPIDGVDLSPHARGEASARPHARLFFTAGDYRAVREGDWKLQTEGIQEKAWLFNLADDPGESRNLADQHPERVAALKAALEAHAAEHAPPLWPALLSRSILLDATLNKRQTDADEYVFAFN